MEPHGIGVGVSNHLSENIQLLGHAVDVLGVVLGELLQLVCGGGVEGVAVVEGRETVAVGADDVVGPLLEDVQTHAERLHLVGGVVVPEGPSVPGQGNLDGLESRNIFLCPEYSTLEGTAHLAAPLEDVLDHVLAPAPHLVALLHEELVEAHPVDPVGAEGRGHQEEVHAVDEVVHDDPVEPVGVPLEAPVDGVTAAGGPVVSRG